MYRYLFLLLVFFSLRCTLLAQEQKFSFIREKMASPFMIILYDNDSTHANYLANECFNLVDSFVNIFSDYMDSSELNKLSLGAGFGGFMPVSPALFDIIKESQNAFILSKGAFDITIGPITRLWRKARKEKKFPTASAIAEKMKSVGFDKVLIDTVNKSIKLLKPLMQLDLGGIAQGYIAQKVLERLSGYNIKKVLVDVSGDIATGNAPPGKEGWVIGINLPESEQLQNKKLQLHNLSVSTSGDLYQFIEHEGKRYSHIIDPKTGYGITTQKNVTVIADNTTTADWLATACSIMPVRKAKRLAKKMHTEILIAQLENERINQSVSKNFKRFYYINNKNH